MLSLPRSLQQIADSIGREAALKLVDVFGGTRLWIPSEVGSDHPIAKCLGLEKAAALSKLSRNAPLDIPRCHKYRIAARDRSIIERYRNGEKLKVLAREFEMTEGNVARIVRENHAQRMPLTVRGKCC